MAAAAGLSLVPRHRRDPTLTTSRGVGELIRRALDHGVSRILIGCGDSGINDGGAGMARALGARLLDAQGHDLPEGGGALRHLRRIDIGGLDPRLPGPASMWRSTGTTSRLAPARPRSWPAKGRDPRAGSRNWNRA